ncbi:MAG: restriction endonuclease subunit S [Cetobacterium sp.]
MKYRYREPHEMKDSGVEWLGMIPKDWEVKKIKRLVREVKGGVWGEDAKKDSNDVPCIRITNFNRTKNIIDIEDLTIRNLDYLKQKDFLLQNGDLLIEKSGGGERQPVGFTCIYNSDLKAIYANFIARVRVKKNIYSPYINFLFSVLYSKKINLRAFNQTTGIQNLSIDKYFDEIVMIPLFSTQQKIADFLDKKCEEFDSVIAKKEMLINKLEEAKKSLISEVVTGKVKVIQKENGEYGIIKREAHEMKDSGVEWLGMIPKEWIKGKLKYFVKLQSGCTITSESIKIKDKYMVFGGNGFRGYTNLYTHRGDYILIGRQGALCGNVNYAFGKFWASEHAIVVTFIKSQINLYYMGELLRAMDLNQYSMTAAQPGLSVSAIENLVIPFASVKTQNKIGCFIQKKIIEFDSIITKQKEIIEKLKSAKQSLISEAVTGKIEIL